MEPSASIRPRPHLSCRLQRCPLAVAATAAMVATAAAVLAVLHGTLAAGGAAAVANAADAVHLCIY